MKWTFPPKENALIIWITTYIQNFRGFWPTAGLWRPDWNRISTDLDVGFGGGWGNNPRGSSRRLLLITASFTGSDTEIDGAGKIGLAVEENKDRLVFEARDKDSEEALVLSHSANFLSCVTWRYKWRTVAFTLSALKPYHWPLLCCRSFENFLEFLKFHNLVVTRTASFRWHSVFDVAFIPYKPL